MSGCVRWLEWWCDCVRMFWLMVCLVVMERLGHGVFSRILLRCQCFGRRDKGLVSPCLLFGSLFSCVAGIGISSGFHLFLGRGYIQEAVSC